jgi:hypothetical protein
MAATIEEAQTRISEAGINLAKFDIDAIERVKD